MTSSWLIGVKALPMKIVFHITDKNSSVERITTPYTTATDEGSWEKIEILIWQSCPSKREGAYGKKHSHQRSLGINIKCEKTNHYFNSFLPIFHKGCTSCINLLSEVFTTDCLHTMRSFSIHYAQGNGPCCVGKYLLHLIRVTHNLTTITASPYFVLFRFQREK